MADNVTIIDTPPPAPPPAPTKSIQVSAMPEPATPLTPPKPGSAKSKMFEELRKKAGDGTKAPGSMPEKKAAAPETKPEAPVPDPELEAGKEVAAPEVKPGEKPPEGKTKANPWELHKQAEAKAKKLEQELSEVRKQIVPEAERKTYEQKLSEIQKRNQELEDEIRYVNFEKSAEFKQKYDAPYQEAWKRAMAEVSEITIDDPAAGIRAVTTQDILTLVNLPLGEARKLANELYGDFADDVMAHRKEIRHLFENRSQALEEAKKSGEERDKQRTEQWQKYQREAQGQIKKIWDAANQKATSHEKFGKFFTPIEGDEEGNQRLAKGFELVDRAFSENPMDPKLTPEQRESVVKRHAVVRNRAAAFGRNILTIQKLEAKLAELEKELKEYKGSEPTTEAGQKSPSGEGHTSARQSVFDALRKRAKNI